MTKLLFIDRFFYPDLQATSVLLTDLVEETSKSFSCEVLSGPPSGFKSKQEKIFPFVKTIPAFQFGKKYRIGRILNYLSFLFVAFLTLLFHLKVDLVIVQTTPPLLPWVVSLVCRLRGFPYIYVANDIFPETALRSGELHYNFLTQWLARLNLSAFHHASFVVVIGRDMKEVLVERGFPARKIEIIPNWVNAQEIIPVPKKNKYSLTHNLSDFFVVMHAGNFGCLQDFGLMLETAKLLADEKRFRLVLVGDGAAKESVINQMKKQELGNVIFLPFTERSELSELLASADIHLVSLKRGLAGYSIPSKTYPIMASARPILALLERKSETARVVEEAECGAVMESAHAGEIATFIRELMAKPKKLEEWGKNGRAYIEKMDLRKTAFKKYREVFLKASGK